MVLLKNGHFSNFFFLGNIGQENVFSDILERKNIFLGYKNKKFKKSKNCHFFKGISPWFWSKMAIFSTYFFQAIQPRKMCFMIFQNQKTTFYSIRKKNLKSRKIHIFPKGLVHRFGQKWLFLTYFFLGNICQENVFYDILERKNNFLGYKKKKFKKSKNCHFFKEVRPWFWSKIPFFQLIFLGNIGKENVCYDILEQKNNFFGYKNMKFKKSKNCYFVKGVRPWFWSKMAIFPTYFFQAIYVRKMCFMVFQNQKTTFYSIKKKFKKSKKFTFF